MFIQLKNFFKKMYHDIVLINDTPHRIAGGFALGVFLGLLPGSGPLASVVMAYILRVNKAAALAGSLLTNTWFSVLTFVLAVKIGAWLTSTGWNGIYQDCKALIGNISWNSLIDGRTWAVLKPVVIGYAVLGLCAGLIIYAVCLIILHEIHRKRQISSPPK